ncbi:PIN domain-containing protein [Chamaesiphon sp. OTE_20_metabat_361]|uniref:type II toxin-antitoxin system VapC family toxin n=1 Tax=Chamaesiphon sp. OTE_20_metabat_361 TaxID=2964689 RepID=UPI00286BF532|nr:PIN domain-containing protein [Chamaesiphon sp. OTE_20_metabat_361]
MTQIVLLDSTPVGLITNPKATPLAIECQQWLESLLDREFHVVLPEIIDYEIRRELLRVNKIKSIRRLDELKSALTYLPITTEVMIQAAQLWAKVRQQGKPTADNKALDGDVILAAQSILIGSDEYPSIMATSNPKHLSLFVNARGWQNI